MAGPIALAAALSRLVTITCLSSALLIRRSERAAGWVAGRLPSRLAMFGHARARRLR